MYTYTHTYIFIIGSLHYQNFQTTSVMGTIIIKGINNHKKYLMHKVKVS